MANFGIYTIILVTFAVGGIYSQSFRMFQSSKCKMPAAATQRIEKMIGPCQKEIKIAILKEALDSLRQMSIQNVAEIAVGRRTKRNLFTKEEQRIAGCLLQCVYRKVNALDANGIPTVEGLINLYADNIMEREYFLATAQAVQKCLYIEYQIYMITNSGNKKGQNCDLAYKVFDCISDQLAGYCSEI